MVRAALSLSLLVLSVALVSVCRGQATPSLHLSHDSTVHILTSGIPSGSGSMLGDRLVLTCLHVVVQIVPTDQGVNLLPLPNLTVTLPSGETIAATIVSFPTNLDMSPADHDFAFLHLEHKPTSAFSVAQLATEKESTQLGDEVVFSGYPLNTPGMVSHKGMISGSDSTKDLIFIEASINKGNSGGGVLNKAGHIVGLVSMREGGITQGLADLRTQINATSGHGSVTLMGVNPLTATKQLIDTIDLYISTGIGYARSIRFARDYLSKHPEIAK